MDQGGESGRLDPAPGVLCGAVRCRRPLGRDQPAPGRAESKLGVPGARAEVWVCPDFSGTQPGAGSSSAEEKNSAVRTREMRGGGESPSGLSPFSRLQEMCERFPDKFLGSSNRSVSPARLFGAAAAKRRLEEPGGLSGFVSPEVPCSESTF